MDNYADIFGPPPTTFRTSKVMVALSTGYDGFVDTYLTSLEYIKVLEDQAEFFTGYLTLLRDVVRQLGSVRMAIGLEVGRKIDEDIALVTEQFSFREQHSATSLETSKFELDDALREQMQQISKVASMIEKLNEEYMIEKKKRDDRMAYLQGLALRVKEKLAEQPASKKRKGIRRLFSRKVHTSQPDFSVAPEPAAASETPAAVSVPTTPEVTQARQEDQPVASSAEVSPLSSAAYTDYSVMSASACICPKPAESDLRELYDGLTPDYNASPCLLALSVDYNDFIDLYADTSYYVKLCIENIVFFKVCARDLWTIIVHMTSIRVIQGDDVKTRFEAVARQVAANAMNPEKKKNEINAAMTAYGEVVCHQEELKATLINFAQKFEEKKRIDSENEAEQFAHMQEVALELKRKLTQPPTPKKPTGIRRFLSRKAPAAQPAHPVMLSVIEEAQSNDDSQQES